MASNLIVNSREAGTRLAIMMFVASQFVEINLFSISRIPITTSKVIAGILSPLSLILIGRVRINNRLVLLALSFLFAYSMAALANCKIISDILSADIVVVVGLMGALVLYTALTERLGAMSLLARTWVGFSLVTGIITFLQAVGVFPFLGVPNQQLGNLVAVGGLYRGVGFKFDPNFQALMLVIGIGFAQFFTNRFRSIITSTIFLGIVGTFSRMGLILALMSLAMSSVARAITNRNRRVVIHELRRTITTLIAMTTLLYCILFLGPSSIRAYLVQRFAEVGSVMSSFFTNDGIQSDTRLTSARQRLILANAALEVVLRNCFLGVGPYQTDRAIFMASGIQGVAHNTYLEFPLIGGIWGVLSLMVYAHLIVSGLTQKGFYEGVTDEKGCLILLVIILSLAGFFLSLTFNSIIWLPVVMSVAIKRRLHRWGAIYKESCV